MLPWWQLWIVKQVPHWAYTQVDYYTTSNGLLHSRWQCAEFPPFGDILNVLSAILPLLRMLLGWGLKLGWAYNRAYQHYSTLAHSWMSLYTGGLNTWRNMAGQTACLPMGVQNPCISSCPILHPSWLSGYATAVCAKDVDQIPSHGRWRTAQKFIVSQG